MFEGKYFLFTLEKGVGVLTLNRPPYNIFEAGFYVELGEVEDVIAQTEGIRCLIIKGPFRAARTASRSIAAARELPTESAMSLTTKHCQASR